jgi:hypothetical protein
MHLNASSSFSTPGLNMVEGPRLVIGHIIVVSKIYQMHIHFFRVPLFRRCLNHLILNARGKKERMVNVDLEAETCRRSSKFWLTTPFLQVPHSCDTAYECTCHSFW